jgi:acetylornithine deacetylase/succinyl-diaminopimelate desuccinylase-like protein
MTTERPMDAVDRYIDEHLSDFIADLRELCALPSVSALGQSIEEAAEVTRALLEKYGFDAKLMANEGPSMVYGEIRGAGPKTVICYNHYDVQPAEPLELWESPPFDLTERDGKLFARGVVDDKGHIICRLAAIAALRAVYGEVPCSVKMLVEGDEEVSSAGMESFVERHDDLLAADGCLWESGGIDNDGYPEMSLGVRGDLYVELRARTLSHDAHSGTGGSIFPNAAWRLTWALASLKGPDERIRVPGWYDEVRGASERDMELLASLLPIDEEFRETYGVREFLKGVSGVELMRQQLFDPTCTIAGLGAGYQGPGSKTVLPAEAMGKVDFRLVPDQDPDDLERKLRAYLVEQGFDDIEVIRHGGSRPARVDPNDPFVRLVADAAEEVYGVPARISPTSGGSGPMDPFVRFLKVPIAEAGVSYPGSLVHAPNENLRIGDLANGIKHTARVLARMGA